jgi:hypothetical protein
VSVLLQELAGFSNSSGDRRSIHGEEFAQDGLGAEFPEVEHGGQDTVGVAEPGVSPCSRGAAALGATACVSALLVLAGLWRGEFGGDGIQP